MTYPPGKIGMARPESGKVQNTIALRKYFSCTAQMPRLTWSIVATKTRSIDRMSSATVRWSETKKERRFSR
jgi:hypothetical protein